METEKPNIRNGGDGCGDACCMAKINAMPFIVCSRFHCAIAPSFDVASVL